MPTPDSFIGTLIDNRYRVVGKLGTGGMASVYLAEDQVLGRRVAIKLLDERHSRDEQFVERFHREAESAAGLSHPNVVSIYDRGETDGTYYIAMEYLEGQTLKELLVARGPTPVRVAIDYTRQILSALDFAHRNGVVHRDIKPHNVVVAPDGRLKVADFGIARSGASQMTEAGSIIGTAQYLSPEQAQGAPVNPSSDLYSVGVVLYEMLTGTVPFTGDTALEIAMKHLSAVPEPPSAKRPRKLGEIPSELDLVVLRALAKDPADRYQTAKEMDADLARVAQGMPVAAETEEAATAVLSGAGLEAATQVVPRRSRDPRVPPPYGRHYDYEEPIRRRPIWPWLLAALLLVAAVVAGYYVYTKIENQLSSSGSISVPYVEGELESVARAKLVDKGLHPVVQRRPNDKVPVRTVFDQRPPGGNRVSKNTDVLIVVSTGKEKVDVPDVRDRTLADAVRDLTEAGLKYDAHEVPSGKTPGTITAQDPAPGTRVIKGSYVRINVSKGLPPVPIPNVVGQTEANASGVLRDAGLVVGQSRQVDSEKPQGIVVDTDPKPGTDVARGSSVTLLISKGPQVAPVPDVTGFGVATAVATLKNAGFKTQVSKEVTADPALDSIVITQTPDGNTQATLGSIVLVIVGQYVAPPPPPPPPPDTTPTDTTPTDSTPTDTTPTDTVLVPP